MVKVEKERYNAQTCQISCSVVKGEKNVVRPKSVKYHQIATDNLQIYKSDNLIDLYLAVHVNNLNVIVSVHMF